MYMALEYSAKILKVFEDLKCAPLPLPTTAWKLCWVLSGPQRSFWGVGEDGINQTRQRLLTGFDISRKVAAIHTKKHLGELSLGDIEKYGIPLLFNGWNDQNQN